MLKMINLIASTKPMGLDIIGRAAGEAMKSSISSMKSISFWSIIGLNVVHFYAGGGGR